MIPGNALAHRVNLLILKHHYVLPRDLCARPFACSALEHTAQDAADLRCPAFTYCMQLKTDSSTSISWQGPCRTPAYLYTQAARGGLLLDYRSLRWSNEFRNQNEPAHLCPLAPAVPGTAAADTVTLSGGNVSSTIDARRLLALSRRHKNHAVVAWERCGPKSIPDTI